jgi:aryl-alcohol dehydrogenase-like predicted oxidoreductase
VPDDSRAALRGYEWLRDAMTSARTSEKVRKLAAIAGDLDCSLAQLAIAWCTKNPHVSTVITGASRVAQVRENMIALEVASRLDDEVLERIDAAVR